MKILAPVLLLMVLVLSLTRVVTASRLLASRHERESTATRLLLRHGRAMAAVLEEHAATKRVHPNDEGEPWWIAVVRREVETREGWSFEEDESAEGRILVKLPGDGLSGTGRPGTGVITVYEGTVRGVYLQDDRPQGD